jgi:hypothetical protein
MGLLEGIMAEPISTSTAAAVSGAMTFAILDWAGVDPVLAIWGFLGGLVALSRAEPAGRWRAFSSVGVAILVATGAGGLIEAAAHHYFPALGVKPVQVATGFLLGMLSQSIVANGGTWFKALVERFTGKAGGGNG